MGLRGLWFVASKELGVKVRNNGFLPVRNPANQELRVRSKLLHANKRRVVPARVNAKHFVAADNGEVSSIRQQVRQFAMVGRDFGIKFS